MSLCGYMAQQMEKNWDRKVNDEDRVLIKMLEEQEFERLFPKQTLSVRLRFGVYKNCMFSKNKIIQCN